MFSLIPDQEKKEIIKDYHLRRILIVLLFLLGTGLFTSVTLLPSRILSSAKISEAERRINTEQNSLEKHEDGSIKLVKDINQKLNALHTETVISPSDVFNRIFTKKLSTIRIVGISFQNGEEVVVSVEGIATDRENLSKFVRELQSEAIFESVFLPISNFAKDKNVPFTLQIKIKRA